MVRYGQVVPIVVNPEGTVVAGHGVCRAANALDWDYVAVVVNDFGTEDAELEYLVSDDATGEAAENDVNVLPAVLDKLGYGT